jgi:predicted flavoprotein YhiN
METDVLVAAGAAGDMAAIKAAEAGRSVIYRENSG